MSDSSEPNVDQLLAALAGKDVVERQKARNSLVEIGAAAVPGLISRWMTTSNTFAGKRCRSRR